MDYLDNINKQEYFEAMICLLMEKAEVYKINNPKLYAGYITLAYDYMLELKKVNDNNV